MPRGNLADLLACSSVKLSWRESLLTLSMQVASALSYLHGHADPIVHTDVKARNILLSEVDQCKLADFGLARAWPASQKRRGSKRSIGIVAGSGRYIAPEVRRGDGIRPCADVWSFGVTLWEMTLRRQFPSSADADSRTPRWSRLLTTYGDYISQPSPFVRQLIASCLRVDPRERPASGEIYMQASVQHACPRRDRQSH